MALSKQRRAAAAASPAPAAAVPAPAPIQDALRLSQEVLRHLPSGIVFFDPAGRVQEANPAARAALGFEQPQGLTIAELFRDAELREPDGTVLGPAALLTADTYRSLRILQRKTMRYTTPAGLGRRLGVTLFPLRSQDPASLTPPGLICLLTDLTAIHALEEELQRRKSLSALGEMAAGIAHEFKNALATISGYGQMLHASLRDDARDQAGKILEQVAMLNNIASEFLTFARPLVLQPERVNLGHLLQQCAEAIRAQGFPQVEIALDRTFPAIAGDPVLLTATIMNLLRNSCEAIVQGGRGGRVAVQFGGWQNRSARILFMDDGPGVAPEVAEKIFIPFFTTKASGTGLGLAMVHKIVTAHQGSVLLADAAPGHTVFAVLLPAAIQSASLPASPPRG
ncbi:MAG TPA: ATP-binding protein [Terriglobales bacterium]|nr:ATP-binding protein [Terriglobales bacterium]